jgi:protein phosphatase 1 regulatory subunit 12A
VKVRTSQQTPTTPTKPGDGESCGPSTTPTQLAIQRKKKPKRRSTGVVQIDFEDVEKSEVESADESVGEKSSSNHQGSTAKSNIKSQNGDIDYKKLWEESQGENARLRHDMNTIKEDLSSTRHQLDAAIQASTKNAVSDAEKREKKLLEKKLAEMEEELKTLEQLKSDNQRLRDENGALIRVISKLSK